MKFKQGEIIRLHFRDLLRTYGIPSRLDNAMGCVEGPVDKSMYEVRVFDKLKDRWYLYSVKSEDMQKIDNTPPQKGMF